MPIAVNIDFFFSLLYAYIQNAYCAPEHRDTRLLCFQAGHVLEQRDQFCSNFHKQPHPKKGLRQTDATLVLLQAFMFKIINLKSSIWLKHLHVRDTSFFHLWLPRHSQFFCEHCRLNCMWAPKAVCIFYTKIKQYSCHQTKTEPEVSLAACTVPYWQCWRCTCCCFCAHPLWLKFFPVHSNIFRKNDDKCLNCRRMSNPVVTVFSRQVENVCSNPLRKGRK